MPPIVWAYIRVSGDEQAGRGLPVAGQRRASGECTSDQNRSIGLDECVP